MIALDREPAVGHHEVNALPVSVFEHVFLEGLDVLAFEDVAVSLAAPDGSLIGAPSTGDAAAAEELTGDY